MRNLSILFTLVLLVFLCSFAGKDHMLFSQVENQGGDRRIRSIIQLDDGRMAFATVTGVEIFNGSGFTRLYEVTGKPVKLGNYFGFHHLYLSDNDRYLWIKNSRSLYCIDLDTDLFLTDVPSLLTEKGISGPLDDFFTDSLGRIWVVTAGKLSQPDLGITIDLGEDTGNLLDLIADGSSVSLFMKNGVMKVFPLAGNPEPSFVTRAYPEEDEKKYEGTSLIIEEPDGFYQIRNGYLGGFFHFGNRTRKWRKILESNLRLNTLAIKDSTAYITTTEGFLVINIPTGKVSHVSELRTTSGNLLSNEISTVLKDKENGLWLGTLNHGILYSHPEAYRQFSIRKAIPSLSAPSPSSVFSEDNFGTILISDKGMPLLSLREGKIDTVPGLPDAVVSKTGEYGTGRAFVATDGSILFNDEYDYNIFIPSDSLPESPFRPFISAVFINGENAEALKSYDGNVVFKKIPSRTEKITLLPDQNFLTFELTSPSNIARPSYFYKLEGIDKNWKEAVSEVAENGTLRATYTALPHGEYKFRVKTNLSGTAPETSMTVVVLPHWWQTNWAFAAYVILIVILVVVGFRIYAGYTRRRIAAREREVNLLERIRHLIEEVDRYKTEAPEEEADPLSKGNDEPLSANKESGEDENPDDTLSDSDHEFIAKAVEIVERNLDTPGYSVEQLSKDLCMDRTGLYRKLTAMLDRSPSLFIRDIRLQNAARLLRESDMSVTEIAEATGFSTTSYMSKCFQERYGCRPSEYRTGIS